MKHKPIPANIRQKVWLKYNKHCAYCGCELTYQEMQVDHIQSLYSNWIDKKDIQDDSIENLMPSCRQCNYYKGAGSIEELRRSLLEILSKTSINGFQQKLAIKYGMIEVKKWDGVFYFESHKINKKEGTAQ